MSFSRLPIQCNLTAVFVRQGIVVAYLLSVLIFRVLQVVLDDLLVVCSFILLILLLYDFACIVIVVNGNFVQWLCVCCLIFFFSHFVCVVQIDFGN